MADDQTPSASAPKKPAARKPAAAKKVPVAKSAAKPAAAAKPVAVRAEPIKAAATRAAPKAAPKPKSKLKTVAADASSAVRKEASSFKDQATARARGAATEGKARAAFALDNVAKLIVDAAGTVDEKVGAQYGDYTRKAADAVSGFADTLKGKDVDELVRDATEFVKKSPAVAIGAAVAIGFVITRLVKAGTDGNDKA
jgi:ElaB/YqjD/DUF883 family membrane-anchored ribosome-binding protein